MSKNFKILEQGAADAVGIWALWHLSGSGVVVIWLALIGWYVEGTFGWLSLALYLAALGIVFWLSLEYIIFRIKRDSKFFGNKPLDRD